MDGASSPKWSARQHYGDYAVLVVLLIVLVISETIPPFKGRMYHETPWGQPSDAQLWRYSFPLKTDTVPPWAVPMISLLGPGGAFLVYYIMFRPPKVEINAMYVGMCGAVLCTAVLTNFVKISVGRPRPDFLARCFPSGGPPVWGGGFPVCSPNAIKVDEGRKSFPSGHTSWSTSGMGYLSYWLAGKLQCFNGQGNPWRLVVSLLPTTLALWIGLTRIQDYWHHWEDVVAGFFLGAVMAYIFYRQYYPALMPRTAAGAQLTFGPARNGLYSVLQEDGLPLQQHAELSSLGPQRQGESSEQLPV